MRAVSRRVLVRRLGTAAWVVLFAVVAGASRSSQRPLHVRLTPFDVAAGTDRIPCEYLPLPNEEAVDVQRIEVRSHAHLHHILVYGYLGDDRNPRYFTHGLGAVDGCVDVGPPDLASHTLGLLGSVRQGDYDLPAGYAVTLLPHQPVQVQTHVFNPSRRRRRAVVRLRFVPADTGAVRHHLEPIDVTTATLELPPHTEITQVADFVAPFDMNVDMLSSHQHRRGTHVTVHPIVDGVDQGQAYENVRWNEPPLHWVDPPLRLRAGDRLRVGCTWNNTTDETVHYGPSANDEMCNLNGYFHRDVDLPASARTGVGGTLVPVVE